MALLIPSIPSESVKWSTYAGVYLFACAVAIATLLSDVLTLLGDVIGLPAPYSVVVFATPALLVGAITWWTVVERRNSYAYSLGGLVGALTALLTGLLWTGRFVDVWGVEMLAVPPVSVLAAFVMGIAALAGLLAGIPLMYARRLDRRRSDGEPTESYESV